MTDNLIPWPVPAVSAEPVAEPVAPAVPEVFEPEVVNSVPVPPPAPQARIEIILESDGNVSVGGPLGDRILFKGMCAEAIRLADRWADNEAAKKAQREDPPALVVPPHRGGRH